MLTFVSAGDRENAFPKKNFGLYGEGAGVKTPKPPSEHSGRRRPVVATRNDGRENRFRLRRLRQLLDGKLPCTAGAVNIGFNSGRMLSGARCLHPLSHVTGLF